ncbi:glutamate--tRNA ligase [Candidatus Nomurabacteria bacterium]|nr:glutamate--tRNA ligase [Candidatus Nomurabacteria bacterium]
MPDNKVVTRFAPSPTGFMHVGGVRTALYSWLLARKNNGKFILRIEDTDKEREVEGSVLHIQEALKWFGLNWDEGPDIGGPHAPYTQSERLELYKKYANILIEKGFAYADPYSEEDLEKFRQEAEANKKPFLYREHRPENPPVWNGSTPLRFKIKDLKRSEWNDLVFGDLSAGPEALDDFILIKSDGYPTYNFCHIVDDIEMGVTYVIRGQEFISSTPKFLALYEALGIKPPLFVSLPHILGKDGNKKLGKRDGAKDVLDYKKEGYLPDAMLNYLAFLGFNPGGEKEIFTVKELIDIFDLNKIQHSGAQWNDDKLDWMNKEHIKKLTDQEFTEKARPYINFISPISETELNSLILTFRDRITKFSDLNKFIKGTEISSTIVTENKHILDKSKNTLANSSKKETIEVLVSGPNDYLLSTKEKDPIISEPSLLVPKDSNKDSTIKFLIELKKIIEENDWEKILNKSEENNKLWLYAGEKGRGKVLWPLRFALSGRQKSPDPFEIMKVIGIEATLRRIDNAILHLSNYLLQ